MRWVGAGAGAMWLCAGVAACLGACATASPADGFSATSAALGSAGTGLGSATDCLSAAACDDANKATYDACIHGQCVHGSPLNLQSCAAWPCNDLDPCTVDACVSLTQTCLFVPIPGCCHGDGECGDACHPGTCVAQQCQVAAAKPGCCASDADAITACDDGNGCTLDYCLNHWCRHTKAKYGCCATAADCDDGDAGTIDTCLLPFPPPPMGQCTHTWAANCTCVNNLDGTACADANPCTLDACKDCACSHSAIPGCCQAKADCDDGDAATQEACVEDTCLSW